MEIFCHTGDPCLDEAGEIIIRNAADGLASPDVRMVLSFDASDAATGDYLILLTRGNTYAAMPPDCRVLQVPYAIRDLESAVRSLLSHEIREARQTEEASPKAPYFDGHRIVSGEQTVSLTGKEAAVFAVLYEHRGTPVSRETLCERVWGGKRDTNVCDVYICRLRTLAEPLFGKGCLVNIRGAGYMLR